MDENGAYFDNISGSGSEKQGSQQGEFRLTQTGTAGVPQSPSRAEKGSGKGLFLVGLITGIAGALLVLAICYLGINIQSIVESSQKETELGFELDENSALNLDTLSKVQMLEQTIDDYFYLWDVEDEDIRDGIYRGILSSLGDPYSEYYTAEELAALMEQTEGIYFGIGAYIGLDEATTLPKISGIIAGAPSEEADLRANDLIYEVDGVSTYGMSLTEFDEVSISQFDKALSDARADGMEGLILDLRANPGGSLNAVVEMARMILPEGMVVYTEDKNGKRSEYTCDGSRELDVPLVVMIDMNSASASEIMAGAIKDYGIGTLVGTTTFGKGIVQQIIPFRDGSAIKLTISAYYTPKGNNIHGIGIEPDVVCEFDGKAYYGSEDRPDNQLEKAKEVLRDKMK